MHCFRLRCGMILAAGCGILWGTSTSSAAFMGFADNDSSALMQSIPEGFSATVFQSPTGTFIDSGSSVGGITFTYTLPEQLQMVGPNSLGSSSGGLPASTLITFDFDSPIIGLGMVLAITGPPPAQHDVILHSGLMSSNWPSGRHSNDPVKFMGFMWSEGEDSFTSATLATYGTNFSFQVQDLVTVSSVTAVPEPSSVVLTLVLGAIVTGSRYRKALLGRLSGRNRGPQVSQT